MTARPNLSRRAGVTLPVALLFFCVTIGVVVGALELSNTTHRVAVAAQDKAEANVLATSGVYAMYDAIWRRVRLDGTYPLNYASTPVSTTLSGETRQAGSYSGFVVDAGVATVDLGGGATRYDYTFVVKGQGVAARGARTSTVATFTGSLVKSSTMTTAPNAFPLGAVQSNTNIGITSPKGLQSEDSYTGKGADFFANKGVSISSASSGGCGGTSGTQEKVEIQGKMFCAQTPTTEYLTTTRGYFSPLASSGKFTTVSDSSCGARSNEVSGAPLRSYPSASQVDEWCVGWRKVADGPNCRVSLGTTETSTWAGGSTKVLQVPAIIKGNLTVSAGTTVQVTPTSTDPSQNVLYVEGALTNKGTIVNYGCTIVAIGKYTDTKTAKYSVEAKSGWYTFKQALQNASLVSASTSSDAVHMSTDVNSTVGFVYAGKGGLVFDGENECRGALMSGGATGGVTINAGTAEKFHIHYEPDCLANKLSFGVKTAGGGATTVTTAFLPSKPYGWNSFYE